jgi:hypothetical protein
MLENAMREPGPGTDAVKLTMAGTERFTCEPIPAYSKRCGSDDGVRNWGRVVVEGDTRCIQVVDPGSLVADASNARNRAILDIWVQV